MKRRVVFYTKFKNVPYTDEAWDSVKRLQAAHPLHNWRRDLTCRPNHPFKYGPTTFSHEEARKVCEEGRSSLKAQAVMYTVSGPNINESWYLCKRRGWIQIK